MIELPVPFFRVKDKGLIGTTFMFKLIYISHFDFTRFPFSEYTKIEVASVAQRIPSQHFVQFAQFASQAN